MLSSTTFNRPGLTESRRMNDHTSKNFDLELESLRTRVLEMGGLAEQQVRQAVAGLYDGNKDLLETVIRTDERRRSAGTPIAASVGEATVAPLAQAAPST